MTLTSWAHWFKRQPRWIQQILYVADLALNVWLKGTPGETVSENLAERAKAGEPIGIAGCAVLDAADPGHCARADVPDEEQPMRTNGRWWVGLVGSALVAMAAQAHTAPEPWNHILTIVGILGTALSGIKIQPAR